MIFIFSGKDEVENGKNMPLIHIPSIDSMESSPISLEDFQWWSYSKDFQKWLDKNPREWQAESFSSDYSESDYINENRDFRRLKGFDSFISDYFVNEADEDAENKGGVISEEVQEKIVKFIYAYNRLASSGKLDNSFSVQELEGSEEYALFMEVAQDNDTGLPGSLQAFKTKFLKTSNGSLTIVKTDYVDPYIGEIGDGTDVKSFVDDTLKYMAAAAGAAGITALLWQVAPYAGGAIGARWMLSNLTKKFIKQSPKQASSLTKGISKLASIKKIKNAASGVLDIATLKNTRGGVGATMRASKIKNIKPVGLLRAFMRGSGISNVFPKFMGKAGVKVGGKAISKAIPLVGEILMVADAAYSLWSWNRDSQAPKYSEVDDFAFGEFNPKEVKKGEPITICWSQPSGTWLDWVTTSETRTTMEMIKIGSYDGKEVFIITQANSKGLQKFMGENSLILGTFEKTLERGFFDNDDIDFGISKVSNINEIFAPFIFKGITTWDEYTSTLDDCPGYYLESNNEAPKEYEFNFADQDEERINVSGSLLQDDDLSKLSESDLEKIFGYSDYAEVSESEDKAKIFTKYSNFLNEEESDKGESIDLPPDDATGPRPVAIYSIDEISYADPSLTDNRLLPQTTYFLVYVESLSAKDGDPVLVFSSSELQFEDAIRGLFKFEPKTKDLPPEETKEVDKEETESKDKEGDLITTPKDVKYKERRDSVIIRDRIIDGGISIMNEFLTDEDKVKLQIKSWKSITKVKVKKKDGVITKVILRNSKAGAGDREREYTKLDGESFDIAKKLVDSVKNEIKYA